MPITSCDVIQNADVSGYLGGGIIVSDGGSGPFPAHNIFSTLKHGVASLPRRGNLYSVFVGNFVDPLGVA